MKNIAGIILAAGKGTRLPNNFGNKVLLPFLGKELIKYPVEILSHLKIPIYVVIGQGKEEVKKILGDKVFYSVRNKLVYIEQKEQLGTGHAVSCAIPNLSRNNIEDVLVIMGDHGFFLTEKILKDLYKTHKSKKAVVTLLTVRTTNYLGYGVVQREKGEICAITDTKYEKADRVAKRKEITMGVYIFEIDFLKEYIDKLPWHEDRNEFFLSDMVELAYKAHKKIACLISQNEKLAIGINTKEDLERAEKYVRNQSKILF